jgi:hypothetical protein
MPNLPVNAPRGGATNTRFTIEKETQLESSRFDDVVRTWGCSSRRSVLRLVAGTAVGTLLLGQLGIDDADAKCVAPGNKCKGKDGKKKKCCGGAKCQGGKCRCKNGGVGCGKACCAPGQLCQQGNPLTCVNGPLEPGDICDPDAPLGCQSGKCVCVTVGEITACTCREEICLGLNNEECSNTADCCQGFCSEFEDPPTCQQGG